MTLRSLLQESSKEEPHNPNIAASNSRMEADGFKWLRQTNPSGLLFKGRPAAMAFRSPNTESLRQDRRQNLSSPDLRGKVRGQQEAVHTG